MSGQKENDELTQRFKAQFGKKPVAAPAKDEGQEGPVDRSSSITLDQTYQIRFERADIKAIENMLGIGYAAFIRPGILGSLTATEVYLWRGLRQENPQGILVHVFPLTDDGRDQAGKLFWSFLQSGGDAGILTEQIVDGFVACGLFARKIGQQDQQQKDDAPKNSMT
jgi:hypothetical protein